MNIQPQAHSQTTTQALTKGHASKSLTTFERKARETAESFEAVFLSQILKSMSIGLKSDGPFGGGQGEEVFQDVLSEQIATQIARSGGIGLSDSVYREILKTQEVSPSDDK
ncbi:MAG: rod-binding protein [Emcibacter sp.]|nr:rod-binding protein [Emcibacter sp.]